MHSGTYDMNYWEEVGLGVHLSFLGFDMRHQSKPIKFNRAAVFHGARLQRVKSKIDRNE